VFWFFLINHSLELSGMLHFVPITTPTKSSTSAAAKTGQQEDKIDDVRKALEAHHMSWWSQGGNDLCIFALLCTGLATFLQLSLLSALGEHMLLRAMAGSYPAEFHLQDTASQSQSNAFLQAILALPQVESAEYRTKEQRFAEVNSVSPELFAALHSSIFTDSIKVDLRSSHDYNVFFAFLTRPELKDVLAPSFLVDLPEKRRDFLELMSMHALSRRSFVWLAVGNIVLLFLTVLLFMRNRLHRRGQQVKTLLLLGTDIRTVRRPFLLEMAAIVLGSLFFSFLFVGIGVSFSVLPLSLITLLRLIPWLVLVEICVSLALVTLVMQFCPLFSRTM
jgi:cell division protein FtsX